MDNGLWFREQCGVDDTCRRGRIAALPGLHLKRKKKINDPLESVETNDGMERKRKIKTV
jgi:hypothetical protein